MRFVLRIHDGSFSFELPPLIGSVGRSAKCQMGDMNQRSPQWLESQAVFATTHWSVVLSARDEDTAISGAALETLCQTYWNPVYAYVCRQGHSPADAQDMTQGFFARLLKKDYLQSVAREKGRFRTFLLVTLKRFLVNEWTRGQAQKRGGGCAHVPLAGHSAETRHLAEPADHLTAEKLYDRRWAMALLDRVLERLSKEFAAAGKAAVFDKLKESLMAEKGAIPHSGAGVALGMSEGAVRVAVHRLRGRFRELFREEVARTVGSAEEIEEEIRHLLAALTP
jgi:RNA polymerase sigma-70 factor (ECF subfamily)